MKTQMRFQKILMFVSLAVAALTFVFGLAFLTGSLGRATHYIDHIGAVEFDLINAKEFVTVSQSMTGTLITLGVVFIVLAALLFVTSCHSRRKYYITNYIAIGLFVAFALAMFVYILITVITVSDLFLNGIAWEEGTNGYYNVATQFIPEYPIERTDTITFTLGYIMAVLVFIDAAFVTLSTVWKVLLMKGEKRLLESSAKVEPAEEVA